MKERDQYYQRLIEPIEEQMMGIIGRIVRQPDDCADVMQEVLAVVWKKLSWIDRQVNPHAYILRICITRSYDFLRQRMRHRANIRSLDPADLENLSQHDIPTDTAETNQLVLQAVGQLPQHQGKALLLRSMENMSYQDIGQIVGCTEATARSHVYRGRQRLRVLLTKLGILIEAGGEA